MFSWREGEEEPLFLSPPAPLGKESTTFQVFGEMIYPLFLSIKSQGCPFVNGRTSLSVLQEVESAGMFIPASLTLVLFPLNQGANTASVCTWALFSDHQGMNCTYTEIFLIYLHAQFPCTSQGLKVSSPNGISLTVTSPDAVSSPTESPGCSLVGRSTGDFHVHHGQASGPFTSYKLSGRPLSTTRLSETALLRALPWPHCKNSCPP